jgi:heme/copper-type cytochrome/quinol oxidase subunit 2
LILESKEKLIEIADFNVTVKFFCFEKKIETHFIESRLINTEDLEKGEFRLLEVTSKLFVPRNIQITALVTSNDVLHS